MKTNDDTPEWAREMIESNKALRAEVEALKDGGSIASLAKVATDNGLPETEAETIQKAYKGDKDAINKLLGFTKTAVAAAKAGGAFSEFGSQGPGKPDATPHDELMAKAVELRKVEKNLTLDQAYAKVYQDPANRELVTKERATNRPSAA
jgi:hypothetical protein